MSADPFDLARFVSAQAGVFDAVIDELRAGCKRTHWMWFVFPQLRGLGSSTAQFYGISSLEEATAYLQHPLLGQARGGRSRHAVQSGAVPAGPVWISRPPEIPVLDDSLRHRRTRGPFQAALGRWCDGEPDHRTIALLSRAGEAT